MDFNRNLAVIPGFLPQESLDALRAEIGAVSKISRSYILAHKKGGTIAFSTLRKRAPRAVALYRSLAHQQALSAIVGVPLLPMPMRDENSLSVLVYDRPDDHIGWHYDLNFYKGRHFTALLALENSGRQEAGLSAARLLVKTEAGEETIPTPANTLVIFEGMKVFHRATPIEEAERRVVLSMTYCTNPRNSLFQEVARRFKDTSFFGLRALWA